MKTWKVITLVAAGLLLTGQAVAQSEEDEKALREFQSREAEIAEQMRDAERRLEQAARQMAELSSQRLPHIQRFEQRIVDLSGKPRLGVTIGDANDTGPVEGVSVVAITPGSGAADAGLRAGDIITAVNNESLSASSPEEANNRLLDFVKGIEDGDVLDVEYLRGGNVGKVELVPKVVDVNTFVWAPDSPDFEFHTGPDVRVAPGVKAFRFGFPWAGNTWADLEIVELNEGLGRYFGTDSGLLVIKAPESNALQLEDGDVIQSIDGREPTSVRHAMRILGSYDPGETVELGIMRDKKRKKLEVEMPDDRTSLLAPVPSLQAMPPVKVIAAPAVPAVVIETT